MPDNKTLREHDALMGRMAQTLGADLDEAELRGVLPPEMRQDMLMACTGCSDPAGCKRWLDEHDSARSAPGYCRNGALLQDLALRD